MSNKFVAQSFTNSLGQVLNPGDDVVYVGGGYNHRVSVKTGKFAGVYMGDTWDYQTRKYRPGVTAIKIEGIPDRRRRLDPATDKYAYKDVIRCAILPKKRAYKIDMPLSALSNQNLG